MKIKICGLKEKLHARAAAEAGADYLGFVFAPSARQVFPEQVKEIIDSLPSGVEKIGVFVNEKPERINEIARYTGLTLVQLHGDESPELCSRILCPVFKAFRVKDRTILEQMAAYQAVTAAFLLDTYVPGKPGGTGSVFDWSIVREVSALGRVILAGGLTPDNVDTAIRTGKPYGVDVSGGVETGGRKDVDKIKTFIERARREANV